MFEKTFISFGAGVNSVALTIWLYRKGIVLPVVFADTHAEYPETYCYMRYFEKIFLSKYGQHIIRLSPLKNPELYPKRAKKITLEEYCLKKHVIPMIIHRFCTRDWKIVPVQRWATQNGYDTVMMAFAYDERHRAEGRTDALFPLIKERISRRKCIEIIKEAGLEVPRKSGCFFCPYQGVAQWKDLYYRHFDLYSRAEKLEKNARLKRWERQNKRNSVVTLRPTGETLAELRQRFERNLLLFDYNFDELKPCQCLG
jgi:hypothetical protein